jgi:hypothetical protein
VVIADDSHSPRHVRMLILEITIRCGMRDNLACIAISKSWFVRHRCLRLVRSRDLVLGFVGVVFA